MGEGDKTPEAKPAPPTQPELPKNAPKALQGFLECKGNRLTFKPGKIKWLKGQPTVTFAEGEQAGTVNVTIGWGFVSLTLPATVKDGQLSIDTENVPDLSDVVEGAGPQPINDWVKQLNDWLKAGGKQLGPLTLQDGALTIPKVAVPAAQKAALVPGPAPKGGIKAAAGAGAFALGFGLGTLLPGGTPSVTVPDGPVPVIQFEQMPIPEAVTETVLQLPNGPVQGQMTITGPPGSFDTQVTFTQKGGNLTLEIPGLVFTGTIDGQANFLVDNPQGSFEGSFVGDTFSAAHIFEGEQFTADGTIEQPLVEQTVTMGEAPPAPPPLAGGIGDAVVFEPGGTGDQGGASIPGAVGGLFLAGVGSMLLVQDWRSKGTGPPSEPVDQVM